MGGDSGRTTRTAEPPAPGSTDAATEAFLAHRNPLFTVAYEMLGSAADAEDVLQETWLRWVGVDLDTVRDQRAYLVRITTRQALVRLRTLRRRKESYVGPRLPEPLLTSPDVADDVELADSVSMAMLLVLETLTPTERAVFVLREVFDVGYDEIAEASDKSPTAVRQIAHRARAHVAAHRPRGTVSPGQTRSALDAFQRAVETGELQPLLDVLAPDVVLLSDGGGVVKTVPKPIVAPTGSSTCWAPGWTGLPRCRCSGPRSTVPAGDRGGALRRRDCGRTSTTVDRWRRPCRRGNTGRRWQRRATSSVAVGRIPHRSHLVNVDLESCGEYPVEMLGVGAEPLAGLPWERRQFHEYIVLGTARVPTADAATQPPVHPARPRPPFGAHSLHHRSFFTLFRM